METKDQRKQMLHNREEQGHELKKAFPSRFAL
jgi:hypothetical protein